jgi:hypothetical protein
LCSIPSDVPFVGTDISLVAMGVSQLGITFGSVPIDVAAVGIDVALIPANIAPILAQVSPVLFHVAVLGVDGHRRQQNQSETQHVSSHKIQISSSRLLRTTIRNTGWWMKFRVKT